MKSSIKPSAAAQQPMIVKYVETTHNGIQSQTLARYAIGYVLRGTKCIYNGDKRQILNRGDVFYIGVGRHYVEDIPDGGQPFEQILFYYTPADLQRILLHLNITYGLNISNEHLCERCNGHAHVAMPGWNALRNFFANTNNYLRDEDFRHDETAENIKMTELIYLIVSHEDCCLKSKVLNNADAAKENFEQIVYDHIFDDVCVEDLAKQTNRSLTSFKKGVPAALPDAAAPVVHQTTVDALAAAVDFDLEVDLRNRQRMHLPQYVAFHQTFQKGVPHDAGSLSQHPSRIADATATRGRKRGGFVA